jgi:hypothetical protein
MTGVRNFFNEVFAEHFAAQILLPSKLVMAKWKGVKDINQMAGIFG